MSIFKAKRVWNLLFNGVLINRKIKLHGLLAHSLGSSFSFRGLVFLSFYRCIWNAFSLPFPKTPVVTERKFYPFWTFLDFEKLGSNTNCYFHETPMQRNVNLTLLNPTDTLWQSIMIAEMNNCKTFIYASFIVVSSDVKMYFSILNVKESCSSQQWLNYARKLFKRRVEIFCFFQ